ncbi:hypothetical protein COB21_00245 [Candidatus Aerophobetes bacterium]|uniref:HlyC/CorC family transporter n=1 Tax=Aerophobetes bacterium TaxID=2030807 RepID=A0A2A4X9A7_UNCAE|nr:MAG: hypothetical protein COB21_00245 [Candidatus Aerophobetes bacterium]
MDNSALFFLLAIASLLVIQGFFSMMEMACVSFNPVRLAFLLSKNNKSARWLNHLLSEPTRLFGTTLIGVNAAMQFGSECARRLYVSWSLPADYAPITQVLLVLLFAELCPMIAARRCSEHVVMLGMPLLRVCVFICRPIIAVLDGMSRLINFCLRIEGSSSERYLSRDDIEQAISQPINISGFKEGEDPVMSRLFSLKNMRAKQVIEPFSRFIFAAQHLAVKDLKSIIGLESVPFVCLYSGKKTHITGVVYTRDLVNLDGNDRLSEMSRSPWFITADTPLLSLISSFKTNKQSLAIVVDRKGRPVGMVTFDAIIDALFDIKDAWHALSSYGTANNVFVHRRFLFEAKVFAIEKEVGVKLPCKNKNWSLEELVQSHLKHPIEIHDIVVIGRFKFSAVQDTTLLGKTILIESV